MIFLSNAVIVFLLVEALLLSLLLLALYHVIPIIRHWDFADTSPRQYALEKRSYLAQLIIFFTLAFKIALLPYFAYMIDGLSLMVPGAMCAAGVLGANDYGAFLLGLKVAILFGVGLWIILNRRDLQASDYPYTRLKYLLFLALFALIAFESALDWLYLSSIATTTPVSCCSSIYGASTLGSPIPFGLSKEELLILFYLLYALCLVAALYSIGWISLFANAALIYIGYYAVVYFFGLYIYELPTHQCPFCMLQREYGYVGYAIWGTLLLGGFFGIASALFAPLHGSTTRALYRLSALCNTLFVLICSTYVLRYYFLNGVWL
ncbi:MAG: hypothetical protein JXK05_07075 [Campylobacterales bacterium]|nr:hypothetical protein [Campylobacterales bacterium]